MIERVYSAFGRIVSIGEEDGNYMPAEEMRQGGVANCFSLQSVRWANGHASWSTQAGSMAGDNLSGDTTREQKAGSFFRLYILYENRITARLCAY